jgi:preprotein translocase subunit SecG
MIDFLQVNIGTILVAILLTVVVVCILMTMRRRKKQGISSFGCRCSHCSVAGSCHSNSHHEK